MKSGKKILSRPSIWSISAIFGLIVLTSAKMADEFFEISKNLEIFTSVYKDLNIYYVDETQPGQLMKTGIDAMLRSLDPYTVYYPESKIEDAMFMQTGQYGGIGTLVNTVNGKVTITEPYQGFPAEKAGIRAGDVILKVNGMVIDGKKTEDISDLLTGTPGTEVEIVIQRPGVAEPLNFKVKREEIKIPDVPYFALLDDKSTGYIQLTGFTQTASNDVRNAFLELKKQGMQKCILDLRGNGGGLLREAINIVNFFVPKGTEIVRTKGKIEEWNKIYSGLNEPLDTQMPLIVLVDEMSASASEIVSGSLQDLDRAVIIGEETFGKGLVQQTKDLSYNTKMKLTVAKYYTPSGRCIQRLDYSHRDNESGKVAAVADSAVKAFKTKNGRTVYDGRGIKPEVEVLPEEAGNILVALVENWIIFDYATQFYLANPTIAEAGRFRMSDAQYNDFINFANAKTFEYKTATQELYKELEKAAKDEKYFEGSEKEFESLLQKISPNKQSDLIKFKEQIKQYLEYEIIARYYYQNGRVKNELPIDPCIKKSLEVFNGSYSSYLVGPGTGAKK